MAYIYDPSQNIKQGFQQAQAGIGDIFTQVIAQKQRDYNLAENTLQNIEALKKNLNIFGQKNITNKANDLLAKTSSAIMKNGKLDYSALGDLRQQVSAIGDLKQGYDLGAKEYERMLQLGIANKDNLISFEKFYKELSAKMGDEKLVGNPQDLQQALADTYSNNLDARAMFEKSFYKQNPLKPVSQDIRNAKGQVTGIVKGEIPSNMTIDANGKAVLANPTVTVMGPDGQPKTLDYVDQQLQQIQQNQPDLWNQMKKQQGFGATIAGDRGVMEYYLSGVQPKLSTHETKSEAQLSSETTQAKAGELKLKNLPTEIALENQGRRANILQSQASIRSSNATADLTQSKIDALKVQENTKDLSSNGIVKDANGNITVNYGKNVLINSAQVYNPKTKLLEEKAFVVVNRKILKDGSQQLIGFVPPADMSKIEALQASYAPKDLITTPLTATNYTNLNSVYVSKPFNKEFAKRNSIAENLASENAPATKQPTPANPNPAPSPAPKPSSSAKIQVTEAEVRAKAKSKEYDYDEYKTYLENNGYVVK